jgi:glycosyltransferase involved in cell wall biosynthesis
MRTVFLVADGFPFEHAAERTFIEPEIPHLVKAFDTVILAPERAYGASRPLAREVTVDMSLARELDRPRFVDVLRGLVAFDTLHEVVRHPWLLLHWATLARVAIFSSRAAAAERWAERAMRSRGLSPRSTVFYTFWFLHSAYGFGRLKRRIADLTVVSRAHGADLYEMRHQPPFIPFRRCAVSLLDAVFPDSAEGTSYLQRSWPDAKAVFAAARLGTNDPGFICRPSSDGGLRIVSCSFLVAVKRVALLAAGIAALARRQPDLRIEWHHFGDGPERAKVEALAGSTFPRSVTWTMHGHLKVEEVFAWYRDHPVDVFVNVSSSEGTPVSVMEASSCAIPIVATAVGGNREAVTSRSGMLLDPNPTDDEIGMVLEWFALNPKQASAMREQSRNVWERNYAASANFPQFATGVLALLGPARAQKAGAPKC